MTCYSSEGDYLKFGLDDPFVVFLGGTAFFVCPLPSMFVPVSHGFQNNTLRTNVNTVHIAHSESEVLHGYWANFLSRILVLGIRPLP